MQVKKTKLLGFLLFLVAAAMLIPTGKVKAEETPLTIETIDYESEYIKVKTTQGDDWLYYSDAKKKTWERAGKFENGEFVFNISWVSKTKDYVIVFKGDKSGEVTLTLPKQNTAFKVTYNCMTETLTFQGAENRTVFWRKTDSRTWNEVKVNDDGTLAEETLNDLRRLYARGAILYFRAGQVMGDGSSVGIRPSKEVKLSLTKQATAPSLSVKSPGTVTVTTKLEYQLDGASSWTTCTGKTLEIAEVATAAFYNGTTPGKDTKIFIRTAATEKKLPSANATLTVLAQEEAPEATSIAGEFLNVSTLQISIGEEDEDGNTVVEKPSSKNPYEYTIVKEDSELADDAAWTAITSESIKLTAEKAPAGTKIYIRKKGYVESTLVWQPESLAYEYVVGEYPTSATLDVGDTVTDAVYMGPASDESDDNDTLYLVKTAGVDPTDLEFKVILNDSFKDTEISSIACGGTSLTYTANKASDGKTIVVKITNTSAYEKAVSTRDTAQTIKITLKNGEVIEKAKLIVLHGASVESGNISITHGLDTEYTFVVEPGWLPEKDGNGDYTKTEIQSLTFRETVLESGTGKDYTVSTNSDGSYVVTLQGTAFNQFFVNGITLDTAYSLVIEMSNGQKIEKGIELHEDLKVVNTEDLKQTYMMGIPDAVEDIMIELTVLTNCEQITATWNGMTVTLLGNGSFTAGNKLTAKITSTELSGLPLTDGETISAPMIFTVLRTDGKTSIASMICTLQLSK